MAHDLAKSPFEQWDDDLAHSIIMEHKDRPGALMPILTALSEKFGFIHPDFVGDIAKALNLSRAEVHGVITFYHDFRTRPPGRHVVKVCQAEACQAVQADKLINDLKKHLGIGFHDTTKDGYFTLEPVYCFGNCACGPSLMINEELYAKVGSEDIPHILKRYKGA